MEDVERPPGAAGSPLSAVSLIAVTSQPLRPAQLRAAIAAALYDLSAHDLEDACNSVGMPAATNDDHPMGGKVRYVKHRLSTLDRDQLVAMTHAIVEEFGYEHLLDLVGPSGVRGVDGELKNLIFAANGPKPRIVLRDAINNVIDIVENADKCLVYDRALGDGGLTWGDLTDWWAESHPSDAPDRALYARLAASLAPGSPPERVLFKAYCARYGDAAGRDVPALIPQVYLHYDPYTLEQVKQAEGQPLKRQRMDFLLLFSDRTRVVIEVDGKQHYADGDTASPRLYAEMVEEDRRLRLSGYEVYRFGGGELSPDDPAAEARVREFFDALIERHAA